MSASAAVFRELQQRRQQELLLEEDTTMIQQRYEDLRNLEVRLYACIVQQCEPHPLSKM